MATNALLCRWNGGWHESTDAASIVSYGRREALLSLGAVQSLGELERIAVQHLDLFGRVRSHITATVDPIADADTPYVGGWYPGDVITVPDVDGSPVQERIQAITLTEDDNGELTWVPELKDLILGAEERFEQDIKKMTNGTLAGASASATVAVQ